MLKEYESTYENVLACYTGRHHKDWPMLPVYAWYFNERENIRILREEENRSPPWTLDPILGGFRFTNVLRQDDRVSRELAANMDQSAPNGTILFNSFVFRTFNKLESWEASGGFRYHWPSADMKEKLDTYVANGGSVFGNAYLMTNSLTAGAPKHHFYIKIFETVWEQRVRFCQEIRNNPRLEYTTKMFSMVPGYAAFLGYELALDMEMLGLLENPTDKYTWANPGPGARRGLNFLRGRPRDFQQPVAKFLDEIRWLLDESVYFLWRHVPSVDMRAMENGLCETSKYASVLETGRAKRKFRA